VREHIGTFHDAPLLTEDFVEAARMCNVCRSRGITGTPTDFLLSAVSKRLACGIFTADVDFRHYARCLPLDLHVPRNRFRVIKRRELDA
jgi:hypothetical protein